MVKPPSCTGTNRAKLTLDHCPGKKIDFPTRNETKELCPLGFEVVAASSYLCLVVPFCLVLLYITGYGYTSYGIN